MYHQQEYPPAPPQTPPPKPPTQSPGSARHIIQPKSPRQSIPPPPLQTTPRTPRRTLNPHTASPPNSSPHTPAWVRQNPPPPPPKRSNSQHDNDVNYGPTQLPYQSIREPPFASKNETPSYYKQRSYDKERRRSHTTEPKIYHEMVRQDDSTMDRRKRSNSGGEHSTFRYNRADSMPIGKTYIESNEGFSRSNSTKTTRRDSNGSRNGLDHIQWRPDPLEAFNDNNDSVNNICMDGQYSDRNSADRRYQDISHERRNYKTLEKCIESLMCIFPKVEPLPWSTYFLLSMWCALPPSGFITFFTTMGFGEQVYYAIADEFGKYATTLATGLIIFIVLLYMLDADQWNSVAGALLLDISVLAVVAGFVLLVLLLAYQFPYGMICLFALFNPLWLLTVKLLVYKEKSTRVFVSWLSGPLFTISALIGVIWALWVFADPSHQWNKVARITAASYSQCEPNYELYPDCREHNDSNETCFYFESIGGRDHIVFPEGCSNSCDGVYDDCMNGFILWVGPVLVSMTMFFLSFFCTFFREESEREKEILNFGKIWIFILFTMWVTASLSGTAAGVTNALVALTLASFVASAVFLTVSFSKEERAQNTAAIFDRLREKYDKHLDIIRGLFIWLCAPIIAVYLVFSLLNQFIRRAEIFPCSQPARGEDGHIDIYTFRTRAQINIIKSWNRAKVYTYAIYWGIAYMALEVVIAKLTVVFLSWLIIQTSDLGLLLVTAIIWLTGFIMFLLPPIPGVPVYLTIGVILPAHAHEILGWVGSIAYSVIIALSLKLFASAIQQKLIGEHLSHFVRVRQLVGINSTMTRAMRVVVGIDGLSISKVALLIGGPDWPTSVLCGIMRLSLPQIMIGTVPVVSLITPTCLTGTFLYMATIEEEGVSVYPWAGTLSTIAAAFTALVQFGAMIIAAYYLEKTADERIAEIENIPIDQDVKRADEQRKSLTECHREVTQWNILPWVDKLYLRLSLVSIIASSYMVQVFSCFKTHSLTDTIEENLDGNLTNFFLPMGWVAVSLFLLSCIFLSVFQRRCNRKVLKLLKTAERRFSSDTMENYGQPSHNRENSTDDPPATSPNSSRSYSSRF